MNAESGPHWGQPFRALWENIWRMEQELNLFERRIGDTYYWPLMRNSFSIRMAESLKLHAKSPRRARNVRLYRAAAAIADMALGKAVSKKNVAGSDTVLLPFNRKQIRNSEVIDPLCHRLLHEVDFGRFLVLDNNSGPGLYAPGPNRSVYNWDTVRMTAYLRGRLQSEKFAPQAAVACREIADWISRNFGCGSPLSAHNLARKCVSFEAGRATARDILAASGAKRLFIVNRNSALETLAAAEDLDMPTAELQHGLMDTYHPHYHYPGRPYIPYAPTFFLTFAPYWTENIALPRQSKSIAIGMEIPYTQVSGIAKKPKRAIICSQWVLDDQLSSIAVDLARKRPDWSFVFRPHPWSDVGRCKSMLAKAPRNLSLSDPSEYILPVLAGAEAQIGVYSTTLFQGMALGLRTIVVALAGAECMHRAIVEGSASLARTSSEIAAQLETAPAAIKPERFFKNPTSIASCLGAHL